MSDLSSTAIGCVLVGDPDTRRAVEAVELHRVDGDLLGVHLGVVDGDARTGFPLAAHEWRSLAALCTAAADRCDEEAGEFSFSRAEVAAFVAGAKAGEFDDLL